MSKIFFYEVFTTCWTENASRIKNGQDLLKFSIFDISNIPISILISKTIFYQIFTNCYAQIGPKRENAQNLLKFDKY